MSNLLDEQKMIAEEFLSTFSDEEFEVLLLECGMELSDYESIDNNDDIIELHLDVSDEEDLLYLKKIEKKIYSYSMIDLGGCDEALYKD